MRVLLTNDDGINAKGLYALYKIFRQAGAEVFVVAPEGERSAVGHAITLYKPLRVHEVEKNGELFGYAINGTPADCVKIAVRALMDKEPDVVISGINLGPNVGVSVIYSGTISAATEAAILGIPAMAVSVDSFTEIDFTAAAKVTLNLAKHLAKNGLPYGVLLNVNIPSLPETEIRGVAITRQSKSRFVEKFDKRVDPRGRVYYWLTGDMEILEEGEDTDERALKEGKISITPIHYDMTDYRMLEKLRNWNLDGLLK